MKIEKKVKLKGFTLIELIVVVAVFGLLLAAALSILGPVNGVFKSTVSYADGSAMVDNVSKYVEDNLRYTNRLRIYDSVFVLEESDFVEKYTKELADDFYLQNPLKASQLVPDEKIYVMKIDNPDIERDALAGETLDKSNLIHGRIALWTYDVANDGWIDPSGNLSSTPVKNKVSAVNEQFYKQYLFTTTLEDSYSSTTTDVSNLYLKLNVFCDEKPWDDTVQLTNTHIGNVIAFPLVNLVDRTSITKENVYFYKAAGSSEVDMDNPQPVFKYSYNKGAVDLAQDGVDIYFVFTKAPHIENY